MLSARYFPCDQAAPGERTWPNSNRSGKLLRRAATPLGESFVRLPRIGRVSAAAVEEIRQRVVALDLGAPVSIRVNPRARRLLLRIDEASRQVELVLPQGV